MCGLGIFVGPPVYHLPGYIISATDGLDYINVQLEYELSSSTRFGQFQKFGIISVGAPFSQPTLRKKFCIGSEFLLIATCASDLTFLSLLTSEIYGFPELGAGTLIRVTLEGPKWYN